MNNDSWIGVFFIITGIGVILIKEMVYKILNNFYGVFGIRVPEKKGIRSIIVGGVSLMIFGLFIEYLTLVAHVGPKP